ncbi:FAD-dependent oxidoreductase [Pseudonocardia endophytica]|uniref:FAD-dependent oxidoreductase n=1 Tax=Pseudonocardia endophytica TaxID=401976 RepID=UPI001FB39BB0|nr:FAD-dependent oxidoreductase [Pseudonocardia endophytica]
MNRDHAFVVVGCGSVGSAALYWLSRMAAPYASVLGLERGAAGNARAGRTAAVAHAGGRDAHAALAGPAHLAWRQVESVSGQRLVTRTGGLVIEDPDVPAVRGTVDRHLAVAARHGIEVEELDAGGLVAGWPQFRPRGGERIVHRPGVAIVDLHRADATHVALARGHGAEIREYAPVRALHDSGRHVEVVTDDEVYRAEHVVVAAGAGTDAVLEGIAAPVPRTVVREQVTRYATPHLIDFSPGRFPVFTWRGAGTFRGLPVHGEVATTLCRPGEPADRSAREAFLAERVPGFAGPELSTATRVASVPADREPVLDTVASGRVGVAAGTDRSPGLVSLAGRILAELACAGTTRHPIADFAIDRPALTRPPAEVEPVPLRSRRWT